MISARRAREADLDKFFSRGLKAGAIYRWFPAHSRGDVAPATVTKCHVAPVKPTGRPNARPMTGSARAGTHQPPCSRLNSIVHPRRAQSTRRIGPHVRGDHLRKGRL